MKWYYIDESITDGDRRVGPLAIDEIQDLAKEGKITDNTLVWHSGEESWKPWKLFAAESSLPNDPLSTAEMNQIEEDKLLQDTINEILKEQVNAKHYAGFFIRALAYILDNSILIAVGTLVLIIMSQASLIDMQTVTQLADAYMKEPSSTDALNKLFSAPGMKTFVTIWSIVQAAYFIIMHAIYGATLGKKVFRIHVETGAGSKLNWITSTLRYLGSIFTQLTLMFYGLGYLIVFIDPKRRTIHDFIANTRVVYNTPKIIKITEK